jgi:hypothetical protein
MIIVAFVALLMCLYLLFLLVIAIGYYYDDVRVSVCKQSCSEMAVTFGYPFVTKNESSNVTSFVKMYFKGSIHVKQSNYSYGWSHTLHTYKPNRSRLRTKKKPKKGTNFFLICHPWIFIIALLFPKELNDFWLKSNIKQFLNFWAN